MQREASNGSTSYKLFTIKQREGKQSINSHKTTKSMSHFIVMVIGENPEEQLEPYNENLQVEEYEVGEVSKEEKLRMMKYYTEQGHQFTSFSKCYARFGKEWDGKSCRKDKNGIWRKYSTYNPDSKWDWYVLGGRWSGDFIRLKPNATSGILGEAGAFENEVGIDAALKGDIDFDTIRKEREEKARKYYQEIVIQCGGSIPKLELSWETIRDGEAFAQLSIDEKRILYHSQDSVIRWKNAGFENSFFGPYLEDFQCTEEEFVNRSLLNTFIPYAFVINGEWYGSGDMGWCGISSNEMPHEEWRNKVWNMLTSLPDDTLISFYDCHI